MVILSPPTSRAIDARSSVVAITLSVCACPDAASDNSVSAIPTIVRFINSFPPSLARRASARQACTSCPSGPTRRGRAKREDLERMRAVRANRKLELEQELVRGRILCIFRATQLAADLAEFARPVRH